MRKGPRVVDQKAPWHKGFRQCCSRGLSGVPVVGLRVLCSGAVLWDLPRFKSWFELLSRDLFQFEDGCVSLCCVPGSGLLFLQALGPGRTRRLVPRVAWCVV